MTPEQFQQQRQEAASRLKRMEEKDLTAFAEEFQILENHPLRQRQRILHDELYLRLDAVISLADQCGQEGRDWARKFRSL